MRTETFRSLRAGWTHFCGGLAWLPLLFSAAVAFAEIPPAVTPELLAEADRVWKLNEAGDIAACVRQSAVLVRTADALRANGRNAEAREYYRRAAVVRPWDFAMKASYAEVLQRLGETAAARGAAAEVLELAEQEALLARARTVLGQPAPERLPAFAALKPEAGERVVQLIVAPDAEPWLVDTIGQRLMTELGLRTGVAAAPLTAGKPDRTGRAELAADLRRKLPWGTDRMELYMPSGRHVPPQYLTDDQVIEIGEKMMVGDAAGEREREAFRRKVEDAGKRQQWDAAALLRAVQQQYPRSEAGREIRLALVPFDIGGGSVSFSFGAASAESGTAVVSYHRFAARNTEEPAKQPRLVDRTWKQVLSSLGLTFGLPRCPDARCARAYPMTLAEHDAKGAALCAECRAGFARALGHDLPAAPGD